MIYILDACALIALFKREPGEDKVRGLLDDAKAGQIDIYMNIINRDGNRYQDERFVVCYRRSF